MMKLGINYWLKTKIFKRIAWLVVFTLFFNPIAFDLLRFSPLNRVVGSSIAEAAVADRDGLGVESFWNFYSKDLGAGWKYSINTFTGNLVIQKGLMSILGRGFDLSEGLVYNSLSSQAGIVGAGWQLANDLFVLENADGSVTFKDGDATNHKFTKNADGSYTAPDGVFLKLTKVDATIFTIKDQANTVYRFQNGSLVSVTDEKENVKSFSYDANSRLTTVTDPSGRTLNYSYGANGKLSTITDPTSRTTSFGYNASGRLTSVTDPKNGVTHFSYDGSGRLVSLTDANGHITSFFYNADDRVIKVTDARSNPTKEYATTLTYDTNLLKTTVTDPAGKSIIYTHNSAGNPVQIQNGAGDTITLT
ncbi:MAG: RHS repeat protein, partial [Actinobacteria bacterium]|nr:RHS repeat protein [Actinomycetota bacterium]